MHKMEYNRGGCRSFTASDVKADPLLIDDSWSPYNQGFGPQYHPLDQLPSYE